MKVRRGQYKIPFSIRIKSLLYYTWDVLLGMSLMWCGVIWLACFEQPGQHNLLLVIFGIITAFILGFAFVFHGWPRPKFRYKLEDTHFEFRGTDYYVPPDVMSQMVFEFFMFFRSYWKLNGMEENYWKYLKGVQIISLSERPLNPEDPMNRPIGLTRPVERTTEIYGPFLTDNSAGGHEFRLHACHVMFPGRSEADDIAWMQAQNIMRDLP